MTKEEQREYNRLYYQTHKEKWLEYNRNRRARSEYKKYRKNYLEQHKEERKKYDCKYNRSRKRKKWLKEYYSRPDIKTHRSRYNNQPRFRNYRKVYGKKWREENRERIREYMRKYMLKRLHSNVRHRLNNNMSRAIWAAIKNKKNGYKWEDLIGYSVTDLMMYLEQQFKLGMNWDNYGEWHIDHIIPISWWQFESPEDREFKQCWALANLQPLWAYENRSKGNKMICSNVNLVT